MNFCSNCGTALQPDERFCTACGARTHQENENNGTAVYFDEDDDFGATQLLTPEPPACFCTACGTNLAAGSAFCTRCGQKTNDMSAFAKNAQRNPFNAPHVAPTVPADDEETKKEFRKYMNTYGPGWMTATILLSALLIVSLISIFVRQDFNESFIPQAVILGIIFITLLPLIFSSHFFKKLEADPSFAAITEEFKNAIPMRDDHVRFGKNYIFTKHSKKLLQYSEIKQVYQYIHKTNFVEDERALKCKDINGKVRLICKLELKEKSNEELYAMIALIMDKNPNIKIGYR